MDPAIRLLRDLISIDSVNPGWFRGPREKDRSPRRSCPTCMGPGSGSTCRTWNSAGRMSLACSRAAAGPVADVLRHMDTVASRDGRTVRARRARREDVRARIAGHEGRLGGDDCRRAPDLAGRRPGGGPPDCRGGDRRGIHEPGRGGAGRPVARRCGGRARADRPGHRHRAQGLRVGRDRHRGRAAHGSRPAEGGRRDPQDGRVLTRSTALDRSLQSHAAPRGRRAVAPCSRCRGGS